MATLRLLAATVVLAFAGCGTTCTPQPPPRPAPVPGAGCPEACAKLRSLPGCEAAGGPSKTGVTCEVSCQRALDNAFLYDTECLAGATSCEAAHQCKGMHAPSASAKPSGS